jgi:3-hydroxy-9,10-secoandrosta-1,3,5(10)-triene-9,17-dione monooxygenase
VTIVTGELILGEMFMLTGIEKQLVSKARALAPLIAASANRAEMEREVPKEIIVALGQAGLFRLYQPAQFGGHELPYGNIQLQISTIIGAACGSAAWIQSVLAIHAWMLGSFPFAAQEAVWRDNDGAALVSTSGAHSSCQVELRSDGLVISGRWHFSSGCRYGDWIALRAPLDGKRNKSEAYWCLVKKSDVRIIDVWHAIGLRGTGSNDIVVESLFVPTCFALDINRLRGDGDQSHEDSRRQLYRLPYGGLFPFAVAAPAIGLARGALLYAQRGATERTPLLPGQIRFSEAAAEIDCAELLLRENANTFEAAMSDNRELGSLARATAKRNGAFAVRLCLRAVQRLAEGIGARGISDSHPIRRATRDLIAVNSHAGLNWDNCAEAYARGMFGLAPTDPMV